MASFETGVLDVTRRRNGVSLGREIDWHVRGVSDRQLDESCMQREQSSFFRDRSMVSLVDFMAGP